MRRFLSQAKPLPLPNRLIQCLFGLAGLALLPLAFGQTPAPPTITSLSVISGPVGSGVTLTGSNFSPNPLDNIIYFGAVRATVTAATSTSLEVTVPTGATYAPISVTTGGLTAYSSKPFTVTFSSSRIIDANAFAPKVDFSSASFPSVHGVALADLDSDGKPDLASANWNDVTVSVRRNTATSGSIGPQSFAPKANFNVGSTLIYDVHSVDLDGDGKLDLVTCGPYAVSALRNISTTGSLAAGSFAPKVDFAAAFALDVDARDIDGDGRPDVLTANLRDGNFSVFRNMSTVGNIVLAAPAVFSSGSDADGLAVGDLDGDGKLDVVVVSEYGPVAVFRNTSTAGSVSFAAPTTLPSAGSSFRVAIGDVDNDGRADIVTPSYTGHLLAVYRNNSSIGNLSFDARVDFGVGAYPLGSGAWGSGRRWEDRTGSRQLLWRHGLRAAECKSEWTDQRQLVRSANRFGCLNPGCPCPW